MPSSTPLPQLVTLNGNPDFKPENLLAYEIGYRTEPTAKFSMDVAAFYNVYDNLRTLELGTPGLVTTPVPHIEVPLIWDNKMSGTSCGPRLCEAGSALWPAPEEWNGTQPGRPKPAGGPSPGILWRTQRRGYGSASKLLCETEQGLVTPGYRLEN